MIAEIAASLVTGFDGYVVDVTTRGERGETVVQVLADTDAGITIAQCAQMSRDLAARIEAEGLFDARYRLEISSPGLDRPMKLLRQFRKNIGRTVRLKFTEGDETKLLTATLTAVEDEAIVAETPEKEAVRIPHENITDCRIELPW